jgi:hypothetical protein
MISLRISFKDNFSEIPSLKKLKRILNIFKNPPNSDKISNKL